MEPVFVSLGQDPEVSKFSSKWLKIYILGAPFVLFFGDLQRFLVGGLVATELIISTRGIISFTVS